jgi:imidazolonepropionase-like amidohydrolase
MRVVLFGFLSLSTILAAQIKPQAARNLLVITNVNVVNTRTGTIEPNLTVVIKNGRIASVAKVALIGASPSDLIVNGSGKYLIPGLWDMHVHSAGGPAAPWDAKILFPLYIANGITGIRDMGGDLALLQQRRKQIESGEIVGPRMFFAGPFLDGGKPGDYKIAVNTPEEGRAAVDLLKSKHVDFIKVLSQLSRDTYFAIADQAKKDKLPLVGHVPRTVSVAEASAAGQKSIEHLSGVLEACSRDEIALRKVRLAALDNGDAKAYHESGMQTLATYDSDKAWHLFGQFTDNVTWQVPTLVWWRAQASTAESMVASDASLRFVPADARKEWEPAKPAEHAVAEDAAADVKKVFAQYVTITNSMRKAGNYILAGTDSPDPHVMPGFSLHDELELLVESGFTPFQALQSATFYPALFFAQLNHYGVVETTRQADLVLLDGDPLKDIRNTRKISAVVMDGRYYSRAILDRMLGQAAAVAENSGLSPVAGAK